MPYLDYNEDDPNWLKIIMWILLILLVLVRLARVWWLEF